MRAMNASVNAQHEGTGEETKWPTMNIPAACPIAITVTTPTLEVMLSVVLVKDMWCHLII